mgnify:CR=1 FL=1
MSGMRLISTNKRGVVMFLFFHRVLLEECIKEVKKTNLIGVDSINEKDKLYYRDILKGYTPAELSYVDNFEIDGKREIIATLLSLKLKKVIDIIDNKILIRDYNIENLKSTEKFILQHIKNGKVRIKYNSFKNKIIEEATEDKIVEEHPTFTTAKSLYQLPATLNFILMMIILAVCIVKIFFQYIFEKINNIETQEVVLSVILFIIMLPFIIFCTNSKKFFSSTYFANLVRRKLKCDFFKRTSKGEELNEKIEGLKKYIKDYSLLNERESNSLDVWEEYLIYSVLFDEKSKNILKEMSCLVKIK